MHSMSAGERGAEREIERGGRKERGGEREIDSLLT